jgi:uncharacterized protein YigE (DUF2233 family)
MGKDELLPCFRTVVLLAAAIFWAATTLPPLALAQSDAPTAETGADTESEPDLAGLIAAVAGMTMAEPLAGLSVGSADYARYGIRIHVFDFEQARFAMRVSEQKAPTGSRAGDFLAGDDDVFVINGGFFERDDSKRLSPSGLLIIDGKVVAEEHQRAGSAVIYAGSDGVAIVPRKDFRDRSPARYALQVGPLLVDPGGVKGIYKNDVERHNRSAICLRERSFTAFVVEGGISLFQLADLLSRPRGDGGFGCEIAINLDGGPSTQAIFRTGSVRREIAGGTTVENAIVVSRK